MPLETATARNADPFAEFRGYWADFANRLDETLERTLGLHSADPDYPIVARNIMQYIREQARTQKEALHAFYDDPGLPVAHGVLRMLTSGPALKLPQAALRDNQRVFFWLVDGLPAGIEYHVKLDAYDPHEGIDFTTPREHVIARVTYDDQSATREGLACLAVPNPLMFATVEHVIGVGALPSDESTLLAS